MNDEAELYLQRAENELVTAQILFDISSSSILQKEQFKLEKDFTFYSAVISHSYYCIFYSAKAILIKDGVRTEAPEVHKKTIAIFEERLVETGKLDVELLKIYKKMIVRAEELLGIFSREKGKRGEFTYQKLPQANREPAKKSLDNALFFFKNINKIIRK
ncbi:MAG: HEPN domain-containing protein [Nanoarchaeota archaeon]|nr:HEPN domain-containing protein [Nanoarchaeota archaeon]MBU4124459.1 HEPN domain-containing protein [Nanoarchaeota archaeon]